MLVGAELAVGVSADRVDGARALPLLVKKVYPCLLFETHMMTVDAVLHITILTIRAWVQTRKEGDGVELILGRVVLVFEGTIATLGARTTEEVVVAKFVVIFSFFDVLQDNLVDVDWSV